jgi:long-chain acyl-CoA synthetase
VWHITERAAELCIFSRGCTLVYSNVKHLKNDLALHKPHWMMLVPRVLEKVALGVKDKFSKKNMIARAMIHFFTLVASTKSKLLKVARGQVIAAKKPNSFRRVFSRCLATLLTPLVSSTFFVSVVVSIHCVSYHRVTCRRMQLDML